MPDAPSAAPPDPPPISDEALDALVAVPVHLDLRGRIEMTAGCRDCDALPKVDEAGRVVVERGPDGAERRVQIMHNGLRVAAGGYYGDWMMEIIERLRGHHEPQEERVFHEILRHVRDPRAAMIELGAYWSYYALWFLAAGARAGGGPDAGGGRRALVLEPDTGHLAVGQANAALNGHAVAPSRPADAPAEASGPGGPRAITFLQGFAGGVSRAAVPFATETAGLLHLPQVAVPDLMARHGLEALEILHCDTQGAELAVLRSCEGLLRAGRIRFLVVSTHAEAISGDPLTHQRCLALVRHFGGRVLAEHDVHESFSGDGLIAAQFGPESLADWSPPPLSHNRTSTSLFRDPLHDLAAARRG